MCIWIDIRLSLCLLCLTRSAVFRSYEEEGEGRLIMITEVGASLITIMYFLHNTHLNNTNVVHCKILYIERILF